MINSIFENKFNRETFTEFIQDIILSLSLDERKQETRKGFKSILQIAEAADNRLDLVVFIANPDSSLHARVEITKDTYAVLKNHARSNALVAYISDDSSEWRLSLITTKVTRTKDGIKESISNPRRFSYVLGPNSKVATPSKMLQGTIDSIIDLENKFSLAVVSKEFFTQIATQYSKLVGGTRGEGRKTIVFERTLKLGDTNDAVNANFAIRLIGRLVFCWFLKQKKGHLNNPLIPPEILSVAAVKNIGDYYHSVCVPLFFEVLNKPQPSRPPFFSYSEFFDKVPFLNGGLFQDHAEDNHKFNRTTGMSERRGVVNIPDAWFSELFKIFEEYNFTIDENTSIDTELSIDPEMLGRIFENLLAEVNPETGASARKSTGSFYTPREIVDFMVEESLIAHLKTKTNISEEKLRALSSYDLDDDISNPIDQQERKLLVEAIHNTTVLDPACGSGAFPIGVLQRLVHMLGVLDPECSIYLNKLPPEVRRQLQKHSLTYVRKLGIIRECIHGVDIQPIAIDISRLRCFLTLIVDQKVDDNAPNRGIEPLPNLDFKFVCANTLIKPPAYDNPLFGDEFATVLGELIDEYFAPVDQLHKLETARKLQQLINDKTNEELESIIKSYSYLKDEKFKKALAQKNEKLDTERMRINSLWKSYENIFQNKPVGFFDTRYFFPVVFRNGGFDIVIGNPPYVQLQKDSGKLADMYKNCGYKSFERTGDIYALFYENGINTLKTGGHLCFITSNKWMRAEYGKSLRKFFNSYNPLLLVDLGPGIFETATVDTNILIIGKENNHGQLSGVTLNAEAKDLGLSYFIDKNKSILPKMGEEAWFIGNQAEQNLKEKIERIGKPLKDWDVKIYRGILTGLNEAFIIDQVTHDRLVVEDPKSAEILKPILRGRDIIRYGYEWAGLWIIGIFPVLKIDIEKYQAIKKYLSDFGKDRLEQAGKKLPNGTTSRKKTGNKWFETQDPIAYFPEFNKEKVVWKRIGSVLRFGLDNEGMYCQDSTCIMTGSKLKYLCAFMNSKLGNQMLYDKAPKTGTGDVIVSVQALEPLLIPPITPSNKDIIEQIEHFVGNIFAITKSDDYLENSAKKEEVKGYEEQIDQLVYKLYGLTPEEIAIVEGKI